jgi:hypothetical protein
MNQDSGTRRLGIDAGPNALRSRGDTRDAALALARQARRTLRIMTPDLEPLVYDDAEFIAVLTELALRSRQSAVLILVQDAQRAIKQGHRFIELSRRLSTHIQLRRPAPEDCDYPAAFLIADEMGLLQRGRFDRYEGSVDFHAPLAARQAVKLFTDMWERAQPDPELRRLHV